MATCTYVQVYCPFQIMNYYILHSRGYSTASFIESFEYEKIEQLQLRRLSLTKTVRKLYYIIHHDDALHPCTSQSNLNLCHRSEETRSL